MHTKLEDIYKFFRDPPPLYLNEQLAVCYVLSILLQRESYGTEFIELLEKKYPTYRISDTVLYSALKFLEEEEIIAGHWKKVEGRGRPRRTYQVCSVSRTQAEELASLWDDYAPKVKPTTIPSLCLTGTKNAITQFLTYLNQSGVRYTSQSTYYPLGEVSDRFAFYLNNLELPIQQKSQNQMNPQPNDVVLGGNMNLSKQHTHSSDQ